MGNCLVTKLKESVDNNTLPKLGSLVFKFTMVKDVHHLVIAKPFYDNTHQVTFRIVQGNAFLADTAEAASGVQSVDVKSQENNQKVYLHGAVGRDIYISVDNYYYFSVLNAMEDPNNSSDWPIIETDWNALKYSRIYKLFVRPAAGELEIGTLNYLSQSLIFTSERGVITFDKTKATTQHTPDILQFTIFKTVDMAIDALIYYKDKYSGFYNGPYYRTEDIIAFNDLPADKKAAIYDALYYPLANADSPQNLRQIYFLGQKYTVSNSQLLQNDVVVTPPSN